MTLSAGSRLGPYVRVRGMPWINFVAAADGRFLAIVPEVEADEQPLTVVTNWPGR